ncbi:pyridoxal-phosphate dependent enzyme family protein [Ochrobactrum quorumnocens]|uniref:Pyridoxal-phosphate dependent enzyme family protein n=1 Tax=Ochrobactrum quorumnocens TaxID=271865 RepID=A0A248UDQ7_9HYPH|nr:pyridoxal-phosphate dependent enzyme [[Ochrobactrum] quorumnocens]ASV84957.1 pyridoxal-phosphate dependent enzyme family protein [[Ochrobactrum] quorumnocens]
MKFLIDPSAIRVAADRIHHNVVRTATIESPGLSSIIKRPVYLKLENTQVGGSFKARGVLNKFAEIRSQLPSQRFVAVSGGNFGIAVAQAAASLNANVTIIMPQTAPASSIAKIRALGVPVVVTVDVREAFAHAEMLAQQGYVILDDCDDTAIAEGHGTLALEFIQDCPALTDVFAAVGGGAMLAGVATALKAIKPEIRIWGVETDGANSMDRALRAKAPVEIAVSSIISTLGVPMVSDLMLHHAQTYLENVAVVSDLEAIAGMLCYGESAGQWVELASGAALAGAIQVAKKLPSDAIVGLIVCGGNIASEDMRKWIAYRSQVS